MQISLQAVVKLISVIISITLSFKERDWFAKNKEIFGNKAR